jgi:hypothetical protein
MDFTRVDFGHRVAVALRFVDVFTGEALAPEPFDARIESFPYTPGIVRTPWIARAARGVVKFVVAARETAPVGAMSIIVEDRSRRYAAYEPVAVTLPRPLIEHPPVPAASDFLVDVSLWPTVAFRSPASQTTVIGCVRSAGASSVSGCRVFAVRVGDPPSSYAYTDTAGSFLFRFPGLAFASALSTQSVELSVRAPPLFAASVPILALRCNGVAVSTPFSLDLGRTSLLDVTVA